MPFSCRCNCYSFSWKCEFISIQVQKYFLDTKDKLNGVVLILIQLSSKSCNRWWWLWVSRISCSSLYQSCSEEASDCRHSVVVKPSGCSMLSIIFFILWRILRCTIISSTSTLVPRNYSVYLSSFEPFLSPWFWCCCCNRWWQMRLHCSQQTYRK